MRMHAGWILIDCAGEKRLKGECHAGCNPVAPSVFGHSRLNLGPVH